MIGEQGRRVEVVEVVRKKKVDDGLRDGFIFDMFSAVGVPHLGGRRDPKL